MMCVYVYTYLCVCIHIYICICMYYIYPHINTSICIVNDCYFELSAVPFCQMGALESFVQEVKFSNRAGLYSVFYQTKNLSLMGINSMTLCTFTDYIPIIHINILNKKRICFFIYLFLEDWK